MSNRDDMNHHELIKEELARQADSMPAASVFTDSNVVDRIRLPSALQVGCGSGIMTAALAADAREIVAFDVTPEMIHRAR